MHSRIVPIFSENTVILFIEIQLIHSEGNQKILGLTLFFNSTRFSFFIAARKARPSDGKILCGMSAHQCNH